jgi:nucleotide-binding universal stress UspA family protein
MPVPVLAAVDPVTLDLAPARFAALVAAISGAPLVLAAVHAGEGVVDPLVGAQLGEELASSADEALERALAAVAEDAVETETLAVGASSAPRGLELTVEQRGAGLLVLGAARAGSLLGTTGERLLSGTRCPVARLTRGWERPAALLTVGAAFVDSAEGRAALHGAHDIARRVGARLRVLVVLRPPSWTAGDEIPEDVRVRAERAAEAAVAGLLGVAVDIDVLAGEPAEVLSGVSGELDLLVCGARGYGPEGSALLGGVSRRVSQDARCPVIVLARGPHPWRDGFLELAGVGATRSDTD